MYYFQPQKQSLSLYIEKNNTVANYFPGFNMKVGGPLPKFIELAVKLQREINTEEEMKSILQSRDLEGRTLLHVIIQDDFFSDLLQNSCVQEIIEHSLYGNYVIRSPITWLGGSALFTKLFYGIDPPKNKPCLHPFQFQVWKRGLFLRNILESLEHFMICISLTICVQIIINSLVKNNTAMTNAFSDGILTDEEIIDLQASLLTVYRNMHYLQIIVIISGFCNIKAVLDLLFKFLTNRLNLRSCCESIIPLIVFFILFFDIFYFEIQFPLNVWDEVSNENTNKLEEYGKINHLAIIGCFSIVIGLKALFCLRIISFVGPIIKTNVLFREISGQKKLQLPSTRQKFKSKWGALLLILF